MNGDTETANSQAAERLQHLAVNPILSDQEASDLKAVLHALRCYKFERDGERDTVKRVLANWKRAEAGDKATLQRVWGLFNRKRKTLLMSDLYSALMDERKPAAAAEKLAAAGGVDQ